MRIWQISERELHVGDFLLASLYGSEDEYRLLKKTESLTLGTQEWVSVQVWGINIEPASPCGLNVKCTFLDGPGDTHRFKRYAGVPLDMNITGFIGGRLPAHLPFALMWHLQFVHRLQHVFNTAHSQ